MTKHDDLSTDPKKWSTEKLIREREHGMPAVVEEYNRRSNEAHDYLQNAFKGQVIK